MDTITRQELEQLRSQALQGSILMAAIVKHRNQRSDDRCWMDDNELYAAAGLQPGDFRVGDKGAMLHNCIHFLANRCQPGGWMTYAELEQKFRAVESELNAARQHVDHYIDKWNEERQKNDQLAHKVASLEKVAYEVPLCADHAQTWFTARHFKPGDCWFCQQNVRIQELEKEVRDLGHQKRKLEVLRPMARIAYIRLHNDLAVLMAKGEGDSGAADAVRDEMEPFWYLMTAEESRMFPKPDRSVKSTFNKWALEVQQGHDDTTGLIREAAYFAWEAAGRPEGREIEFWTAGEREVIGWTVGEQTAAYEEAMREEGQ